MQEIKIIANKNYPETSQYQWLVLVGEKQHLVNNFRGERNFYSHTSFIEGFGETQHIITHGGYFEIVKAGELNKVAYIK